MDAFGFIPTNYVVRLHGIPRFGNTRDIASFLARSTLTFSDTVSVENNVDDYTDGIAAFCIFLCSLFFTWGTVLLVLKYYYGKDSVGWAAGGSVVDVRMMRKLGIRKAYRKARIVRNWKVQTSLIIVSCCIPTASFCLFQFGLHPFMASLEDVQELNDIVDSKVYVATQIVSDMIAQKAAIDSILSRIEVFRDIQTWQDVCPSLAQQEDSNETETTVSAQIVADTTIQQNQERQKGNGGIFRRELKQTSTTEQNVSGVLNITHDLAWRHVGSMSSFSKLSSTPTSQLASYVLESLSLLQGRVDNESAAIEKVLNQFTVLDEKQILQLLYVLTNATSSVDNGIVFMYDNDWIVKLFVTALNVCVIFFIGGALLSKNNITWQPFHFLLVYCMVPAFCLLLLAVIILTCLFVSAAIMNADFCAGDGVVNTTTGYPYSTTESPINTITDIIALNGYKPNSMLLQSLHYYATACLSENPLMFLSDIRSNLTAARSGIEELHKPFMPMADNSVGDNNQSAVIESITKFCGDEGYITIELAIETINVLIETLKQTEGSIDAGIDLTACSSISPILRRMMFGATCTTSVKGLTWCFASLFAITILGMMILTLRAGLYNPLIRSRRQKRREKEWEDYKAFMSRYYNVSSWKIDSVANCNGTSIVLSATKDKCISSPMNTVSQENQPEWTQSSTSYAGDDDDFDDTNEMYSVRYINNGNDDTSSLQVLDGTTNTNTPGSVKSNIFAPYNSDRSISIASVSMTPSVCTVVKTREGATFASLRTPDTGAGDDSSCLFQNHQEHRNDVQDDDDDSYDSTYSSDSDEDILGGASITSSVASSFVRRLFLSRKMHGAMDKMLSLQSIDHIFSGSLSVKKSYSSDQASTNHNTIGDGSVQHSPSSSMSVCDIPGNSPSTLYETSTAPSSSYLKRHVQWKRTNPILNQNYGNKSIPRCLANSTYNNDPLDLGRHYLHPHNLSSESSTDNFGMFLDDDDNDDNSDKENGNFDSNFEAVVFDTVPLDDPVLINRSPKVPLNMHQPLSELEEIEPLTPNTKFKLLRQNRNSNNVGSRNIQQLLLNEAKPSRMPVSKAILEDAFDHGPKVKAPMKPFSSFSRISGIVANTPTTKRRHSTLQQKSSTPLAATSSSLSFLNAKKNDDHDAMIVRKSVTLQQQQQQQQHQQQHQQQNDQQLQPKDVNNSTASLSSLIFFWH